MERNRTRTEQQGRVSAVLPSFTRPRSAAAAGESDADSFFEKAPLGLGGGTVPACFQNPGAAPDSSAPSTKNTYDSDRNEAGARNDQPDESRCAISEILQTLKLDSCDTLRPNFFTFKFTRCGVATR